MRDMTKSELIDELHAYKAAVHSLSFELEMLKEKTNRSISHKEIMLIREHAMSQASEFVMNWGVPKSGADLVDLCNQIKKLTEKKDAAILRAVEVANEVFRMPSK